MEAPSLTAAIAVAVVVAVDIPSSPEAAAFLLDTFKSKRLLGAIIDGGFSVNMELQAIVKD